MEGAVAPSPAPTPGYAIGCMPRTAVSPDFKAQQYGLTGPK